MLALYIAIAGLVLLLFLIFPAVRRHPDRKLISGSLIAHRGLHGITDNTPENSLAAFELAAELGYTIEIDIHLTADGEIVVFHDDTLHRMCGVDGKIEDMTLSQLKQLRLLGSDCTIPTLTECLDTVRGRVPLLIEFKSISLNCTALCEEANRILSDYSGKYFIQSFYPTAVRWYKKNRPDICRGQLAAGFYKEKSLAKLLLGCLLFNVFARPDFVAYAHENRHNIFRRLCTLLGALPVCWTLKSQQQLDAALPYFKAYIFESFIPNEKPTL